MKSFVFVLLASTGVATGSPSFAAPLFADGMILQRGSSTQVWGAGAAAGAAVTVTVGSGPSAKTATSTATATGSWQATLPDTPATLSTTLSVRASGSSSAATSLRDVAFGDVLLCGGQSNMGFGMCGAKSATQSPQQALMTLAPLRFYFQSGSGPNGGTGAKCSSGLPAGPNNHNISSTTPYEWFKSNASNSGGYSAVCMLTAQRLFVALGKKVPVGAVESCVGGTPVGDWTPDATNKTAGGVLWKAHMVPLLPMTYKAALWDQGEADAKRTNSTWYASEFKKMITLWRKYFTSASSTSHNYANNKGVAGASTADFDFPFVYVELCTEYGAKNPKEGDFWLAQRAAVSADPSVGYATTTDIQRALHPPDKQDVADRLTLELQRLAYDMPVVSRGPEVITSKLLSGGKVAVTFTNATLIAKAGILVGTEANCESLKGNDSLAMADGTMRNVAYTIDGDTLTAECPEGVKEIQINADASLCFLYSGTSGLPAPPVLIKCT